MGKRITLIVVLLTALASNQSRAQSQLDWAGDLEFMARELPARHVQAFAHASEDQFQSQVKGIAGRLKQNSDAGNAVELMKLAAMLRDGHTAVNWKPESCSYLPLQFHWFPEGIYAVAAGGEAESAFECKLVAIGGNPIDDILQELRNVLAHDNESQFKQLAAMHLSNANLLFGMGLVSNIQEIALEVESNQQVQKLKIRPLPFANIRQVQWKTPTWQNPPMYLRKSQLSHWNDWIKDQQTLYFKYNRCQDREAFQKLVNGTAGFIQQNQVRKFVLDLRDNGGGDSSIFNPLLNYLKSHESLNQSGSLYVIIGRKTFSSAVLNAISLRDTHAIFVGEPTGGKPNHFGEIKTMTLPSSQLMVSYSTKHFRTLKDGDPDAFEPDLAVETTFSDWQAGRDPVLERIFQDK